MAAVDVNEVRHLAFPSGVTDLKIGKYYERMLKILIVDLPPESTKPQEFLKRIFGRTGNFQHLSFTID